MSCRSTYPHHDLPRGIVLYTRVRMAYRFRVALLLLFLWKYTSCQTDGPSCQCDEVLASLRELRGATFSTTSAECGRVLCVNLTQGTEYIAEYSANEINNVSVIISGNDSVVQCMPPDDGELPLSDYTRFPLIFSNSSFVVIEGVHFKGCVRPIRFEHVTRLEFVTSSFSGFYPAGALDISNCPVVFVNNCTFTNNTSLGINLRRFSGNAGAIAIGHDNEPKPDSIESVRPLIRVTGSTFSENNSTAADGFKYNVGQVLSQMVFTARGGAIACYIGTMNYSADIKLKDCTLEGNSVADSGGAVYMFLSGQDNEHSVKIERCKFMGNSARLGGGVELTFDTSINNQSSEVMVNQASIKDCLFSKNTARDGGAFAHIQINKQENLNNLTIKNCSFFENEAPLGSALSLKYIFTVDHDSLEKMIFVEDCIFLSNYARYGVVFVSRNTVGFQGTTTFGDNTGPAIQSFGSLLTFGGDIMFSNNVNHPNGFSGVINLAAFAQILLESGVNFLFINNTGINGGAIVVAGRQSPAMQLYNPQCFLQYENSTLPPTMWNITMFFSGNKAEVAPIVYASDFNACTWFNLTSPFFNADLPMVWSFMDIQPNFLFRGDTLISRSDYYFQTSVQSISLVHKLEPMGSPGSDIELGVQPLDAYGHNTSAFLEIKDEDSAIVFEPSIVETKAGEGRIRFKYLGSNTSGNATIQVQPAFTSEELPGDEVTLVLNPCLPGYFLRDEVCVCEETVIVALCYTDKSGIILVSGLWGSSPSWSLELVTYTCPPGYCDCSQGFDDQKNVGCLLNYTNPYAICSASRQGILCGQCREGYGVGLLTNECNRFTDLVPQFWLFPIYLGIVIPLLVVIVRFGVHLPTILRGFIFYVQISPIAVEYLSPTFLLRVDVMSCFANVLAFYMPYNFNFHEGMTSLESYGLRYVTPLVALVVVPIAARVRGPLSKHWFGVWTVIQLLYILVIHTSASLLLCPSLTRTTSNGTSKVIVWYYDGSISCFNGWHILLAAIAFLSLISLALFIILIIAVLQFDFLSKKVHSSFARLESFSLALTRGFKKECRWWPVIDLTCRYVFVTASVFSIGHPVAPLIPSTMAFLLQFFIHPYEDTLANYMESFNLFVLVALLGLGNTSMLVTRANNIDSFTLWPIFYSPVLVGIIVATAFSVYHIQRVIRSKKQSIKQKYNELISQRISFHKRRFDMTNFAQKGYVTKTEIYLYDDESGSVSMSLDNQ